MRGKRCRSCRDKKDNGTSTSTRSGRESRPPAQHRRQRSRRMTIERDDENLVSDRDAGERNSCASVTDAGRSGVARAYLDQQQELASELRVGLKAFGILLVAASL